MSDPRQKLSYARLFDDLRMVLAVHRCGSMTRAAAEFDTTTSTVSRQIARLRAALGVSPFIKTDGTWLLNPRVNALIEAFEQADGMIASEIGRLGLSDPDAPREIRIGTLPSLISHALIPAVGKLQEQTPGLRPLFENRIHELGLGTSDIAVSFALPESGRIKARRCGQFAFALYAPRSWRHGQGWVSLTDRFASRYAPARKRWFGDDPMLKVEGFAQAVVAMRSLAMAGVLPVVVGDAEPDLVHIPDSGLDLSRDLYLIYHESRSEDADLRHVIDWICEQTAKLPERPQSELHVAQDRLFTSAG